MPLTRTYIKNFCEDVQTYFKGADYYAAGRVHLIDDKITSDGHRIVKASVHGSENMRYKTTIVLTADGSALESAECNCPAFHFSEGICKHIVALSIRAGNDVPPKPEPIKTDYAALVLLREYAKKTILEASTTATGVRLVPTLTIDSRVPALAFKIGFDRLYVVKDLCQLVRDVKLGENRSYGKQCSFFHCLGAFAPKSAKLMAFLLRYYDRRIEMYDDDCYYSSSEKYRKMNLLPFMLDSFFELFQGEELAVEISRRVFPYEIKTENPHLQLHIDQRKNGAYSLGLSKPFRLLQGDSCLYPLIDDVIYRCDPEFSSAVGGLFRALPEDSRQKLTIAENEMPSLAATLLPTVRPYLSIISASDLTVFQPAALCSKVFFDMPAPERVTARLEHHYAENAHMGFSDKDLRKSLDLRGESKIENLMYRYFQSSTVPGEVFIENNEKALYELAEHGIAEISELAEIFATDAFKTMRVKPPTAVSVGVRVDSDLLQMHFSVAGIELSELEQVLDSYRKAKKYHRLRDGSFLNLEDSSLSEFSELAQGMDLSAKEMMAGDISVPKYRALYLDTLLKQSERIQYDRDSGFKQIIRDVRNVGDADYKTPQSLRHILRNYQKTGYRWLRTIASYGFGGILADDMGLGKTLQVIALLLAQKEEEPEHRLSIVICPSSLVLNWESEVHKFAPLLNAVSIVGTFSERENAIAEAKDSADLLLTSYDSLKRDVELYTSLHFQYVIADEAQYMKNQNTQNAKAVKTLQSVVRFALTGTPVENSLAEIWSIFDFLMPGYLYHYGRFRKNFETPIVKQSDESAARNLQKMVSPFILRRMKTDVLKELPDKIETVLYAELEGEQKKLYLANAAEARREMESGLGDSGSDKLLILSLLTRLRQICCDPSLVYENYEAGSAKLELCMELIQNCIASGHRILLFSQFTSMLRRIADRLDAIRVPYFTITGETKVSQRLELVNSFNSGTTPIFLISLKAGGTGLNLTGADVVIHYDPWWNNSAQNQASDRAHRIGQTKTVQVYKLIAKNTLEERILEMQKNKADLADLIVKEGDGAFARMSKSEILTLFQS